MSTNRTSFDEWSPHGPVTELSDEAAWELLDASSFGRLGVTLDNLPEIFPISYHADGDTILFRTASGTKLHELIENSHVVFEADEQSAGNAWSVVAKGTAAVIAEVDDVRAADQRRLPEWIPTAPFVYVRIAVESIRGRRFARKVEFERASGLERASETASLT